MTHVFALLLYLYAITYHPYGGGGEDKEGRGIQRRKHCLIVYTKHWLSLKYAQKPIFSNEISCLNYCISQILRNFSG